MVVPDNRQNGSLILGRSFPNRKLTLDQRDAVGVALVLGTTHYVPTIPQSAALTGNTVGRLRRALHKHNGTKPKKNGGNGHKHLSPADIAAALLQLDQDKRDEVLRLVGLDNVERAFLNAFLSGAHHAA